MAKGRDALGVVAIGDELGALRRSLDLLNFEVTAYIHVAKDAEALRCVRSEWPEVRFFREEDWQDELDIDKILKDAEHAFKCLTSDLSRITKTWLIQAILRAAPSDGPEWVKYFSTDVIGLVIDVPGDMRALKWFNKDNEHVAFAP